MSCTFCDAAATMGIAIMSRGRSLYLVAPIPNRCVKFCRDLNHWTINQGKNCDLILTGQTLTYTLKITTSNILTEFNIQALISTCNR